MHTGVGPPTDTRTGRDRHSQGRASSGGPMEMKAALFPPALKLWVRFEQGLYGAPRDPDLDEHASHSALAAVYNGTRGVTALWKTLLARQTPHVQIVWLSADGTEGHVLAESHIAIPNRLFFCDSLAIALQRQRLLYDRANRRRAEAACLTAVPIVQIPTRAEAVTFMDVVRFALRHLLQKILSQPQKWLLRRGHWAIAFNNEGLSRNAELFSDASAIDDAKWWLKIPCPKDRFYADPFLWSDEDGHGHLFFEDLPYRTGRGVISYVALDPDTKTWCGPPRVVLERPYHLSYPFLFEHNAQIFMIPETSGNRTIEVYRAAPFPTTWAFHMTLMEDIVAADATLYCDGARWWLFASVKQDSGPNWDELSIFFADSPFGPWTAHPANPVISDCRRARMGGNVFRDMQSRLIRPAQNCEESYGAALLFCEITELTTTTYAERPLFIKHPPARRSGLHTWNSVGDFSVVDIKMDLNRWARDRLIGTRL